MDRAETAETELPAKVPPAPEGSRRTVAEETQTHQHARFVVQEKCRRANLDRHGCHKRPRPCRQNSPRRFEHRERGTTAESQQILQKRPGTDAQPLRDMAGQPWTQISRAGAHKQCIDLARQHPRPLTSLGKNPRGQRRRMRFENPVQLPCPEADHTRRVVHAKLPTQNPRIPAEDFLQQPLRGWFQSPECRRLLQQSKALRLCKRIRREGGGERLQEHQRTSCSRL